MKDTVEAKWVTTTIGEIGDLVNGKAFKPKDWTEEGLPIVRIQNLNKPDAPFNRFSGEVPDKFLIDSGQLLFAWSGTPGTSFGAHIWKGGPAVLNQHIFKVEFDEHEIDKQFLSHAINQTLEELIGKAHGGVGLRHVTKGVFEATEIGIPPLPEQRRIVAKLNRLSARSAAARDHLAHTTKLATRAKQAILDDAFSGRLTESWRRQGSAFTSPEKVLQSIRAARSKDRALSRRKSAKSIPADPVPESWAWVSPDELASDDRYSIGIGPFGSNLVKSDYRDSGVRLVFVKNIRSDDFGEVGAKYVEPDKAASLHQHVVGPGDLLITKMGDPPGDAAIFPDEEEPAIITADCIKLTPESSLTSSAYLLHATHSSSVRAQIAEVTTGVAHQKMSLDRFRQIAYPIPPWDEQAEIVRRIEAAFARIDRLTEEANRAAHLLNRLDERLLAKAFAGELVPQNPEDEPAEALLTRIRQARTTAPKPKRGRRKKAAAE